MELTERERKIAAAAARNAYSQVLRMMVHAEIILPQTSLTSDGLKYLPLINKFRMDAVQATRETYTEEVKRLRDHLPGVYDVKL